MPQEQPQNQLAKFKYRGQSYTPLDKIRIRGKLFLVVEKWQSRYKAFDVSAQEWRSIRVRRSGVRYEMNLMQFVKMRNSSVPYVFEHFKDDTNEYLVQEWIGGYDLRHYLRRKPGGLPYFSAEHSYHLMRGLIHGLNRLHERHVFHGDVKPENLIVADTKRLVMIDFGAAWRGTQARSRPDQKSGGYAPPEQWLREKLVDHRADQFATSVVLYEMLTGELPYEGRGGFGSDYRDHPRLIAPSKKNREVWKDLDPVIMKSLSLDKDQRYETSSSWLQEFSAAIPPDTHNTNSLARYLSTIDILKEIKAIASDIHQRSK